ncbi:hypothetical protein BDV37DRAFT_242496 [Aspergillus pseudonomiae]|uniref:Uncharacterized protein n=1 Tax=Aspergillus pseudonomiae TaxID=1506151 RepID=A0A5N7DLB1_9EURO|nr:uncharacterized protein BDV37DRAFT_242496 [Aspergillus pseudonomiae]KAE8406763.1 hypothetical protein BDV37DRAFT_242496 [Aspergillus pseudonomiae]
MVNSVFTQQTYEHFNKMVTTIVDRAFELSLFHNCKVYVLVEHSRGSLVFNSVDDHSWPFSDMSLDTGKLPVTRIHGTDLAHLRFTESERKEFIQLWLFFHYLLCRLDPRQPVEAYLPDVKDPDDNCLENLEPDN